MDKILKELPEAKKNVPLKNYTTYKIGGPAKYFFVAKTLGRSPTGEAKEGLMLALKVAKENKLPIFILGGGSNILISDKGLNGLVIKMDILGSEFNENTVNVGAGENSTKLAYLLAEHGLLGFEWAAGMPGTVGGAIYGNAQAFGTKISDAIKSVEHNLIFQKSIHNFQVKLCITIFINHQTFRQFICSNLINTVLV